MVLLSGWCTQLTTVAKPSFPQGALYNEIDLSEVFIVVFTGQACIARRKNNWNSLQK
jgi:hypothetical protein